MPIDASIYSLVKPPEPFNPLAEMAQVQHLQGLQTQNRLAQLAYGDRQRALADDAAQRDAVRGFGADTAANYNRLLQTGNLAAAQGYQKSILEQQKGAADVGKTTAETADKVFGTFQQAVGSIQTPQQAAEVLSAAYHDPQIGPVLQKLGRGKTLEQALLEVPTDPQGFVQWRAQASIGAQKLAEFAKTQNVNLGGTMQTQLVQPATGQVTTLASAPITQSADNAATNATSRANNTATNATSTANTAATNTAHLAAAGMGPGGLDDNSERTAQAIASGQLPAPTGMALLNPRNQRILGRVMEINPQYDSTTVDAKRKAARDFSTGPQGNAMRSFAVAGDHLDQLGQLAEALDNGNLQIVNKVANAYAQQTGNPAPTNFEAAKEVVSKEVVKAIVAGGGGVSERQELSNLMSNAKSPAQLAGVIKQYRNLMAAQHDALLQQRRAAGLSDATLPAYSNDGQGNADLHKQADEILKGK